MQLFIINQIQTIYFIDETKIEKILQLKNKISIWDSIHWWLVEIEKKEFIKLLPVLNWYVNKYGFYDTINLWIRPELVKLQNIYEIEFNFKKIEEIPKFLDKVKTYINSWKLLTNSKKQEIQQNVENYIYLILQNIIKIYFLIFQTQQNQKDLKKIISSKNILEEYKAQANLLEKSALVNIEKMLIQLDFLIKQLEIITEYFQKWIKEILK